MDEIKTDCKSKTWKTQSEVTRCRNITWFLQIRSKEFMCFHFICLLCFCFIFYNYIFLMDSSGGSLFKDCYLLMVCSFFKTSNPKVLTIFRTSFSDCNCNDTGSDNHTRCDRTTGQCYCKPGVTSRVCDQCMVQHTNFSGDGCDREYSFIVVIKFQKTKSIIYLKDKFYKPCQ